MAKTHYLGSYLWNWMMAREGAGLVRSTRNDNDNDNENKMKMKMKMSGYRSSRFKQN
jgi:hypothetical protein